MEAVLKSEVMNADATEVMNVPEVGAQEFGDMVKKEIWGNTKMRRGEGKS